MSKPGCLFSCLRWRKRNLLLAILLLVCLGTKLGNPQVKSQPVARQDNVREVVHGVEIVDPYRWLEDQDSEETHTWIAAENASTHAQLDSLPIHARAHQ